MPDSEDAVNPASSCSLPPPAAGVIEPDCGKTSSPLGPRPLDDCGVYGKAGTGASPVRLANVVRSCWGDEPGVLPQGDAAGSSVSCIEAL